MSKHRKQKLNLDFQIQYKKYLKGSKENPSKFLPEEVEADLALVDEVDLLQEVLPHLLAPHLQGPHHLPHPCTWREQFGA